MNKEKIKIITCTSGDWVIVEVDGKVIEEGHSINTTELLKFLGHDLEELEVTDEDMQYLEGSGMTYEEYCNDVVGTSSEYEEQLEWEKHREESYGGNYE